ncbi:MAG TPA: hypothetical protein VFQ75_15935 [Candidatus Limnocylindrales bacterium]|jgi:hypothetical protein|nr:hypothetical protein [Candidatus Limnocylindrales bacterium]
MTTKTARPAADTDNGAANPEPLPAGEPPRLTDLQLGQAMRLMKGSDSVELKATVPAESHRATIQGLPLDPVEAQPRQVYFFDTPDLKLNQAGVVVRARRVAGGRADTVIKLRPVDPANLSKEIRRQADFNVEVDVLPGGFMCSGSFKGRCDTDDVRDAVRGKLPISRLYSKSQRAFYREHAPEGLDLDSLVPLGPTFLLKGKFAADMGTKKRALPRILVAEMWLYPDGSRILELSTRCRPDEAFTVAAETRAYLAERGVTLAAVQQTKTKTALEFYSDHLGGS